MLHNANNRKNKSEKQKYKKILIFEKKYGVRNIGNAHVTYSIIIIIIIMLYIVTKRKIQRIKI
jgi:hypothetical protein